MKAAYVPSNNPFLELFPHRWDFLEAEHPRPGEPTHWATVSKFQLSDRKIEQGDKLYGVRFGAQTSYILLDIDKGSIYHPKRDPFACTRMLLALESLGLCRYMALTSSYSNGVHLYLPFDRPVLSWEIALAVTTLLERAGFTIEPGLLEVYPNKRLYDPEQQNVMYRGHRLPLQAGSYLLNDEWQLTCAPNDHHRFVQKWHWCKISNLLDAKELARIVASAKRFTIRLSQPANKFLQDLNTEIDVGWSGKGQTNTLLGKIAQRSYIFGHVLSGEEPLEGDRLILDIINTARLLPGFEEFCGEKSYIYRRAEHWARAVEGSHYYHFRIPKPAPKADAKAEWQWNQWQRTQARDKLRYAMASLRLNGELPEAIAARYRALIASQKLSGQTLYRHRDLWHPDYLGKTPPDPPLLLDADGGDCLTEASAPNQTSSLLGRTGCEPAIGAGRSDRTPPETRQTGCNTPVDAVFRDLLREMGGCG